MTPRACLLLSICFALFGRLDATSSSAPARIANLAAISFSEDDAYGFLVNKRYTHEKLKSMDANQLYPVAAAPIYFALAEAYRREAESSKDGIDREQSYALSFNWYGRVARSDNALMWRARARMMDCYLNGEGVAQNIQRACAFADVISQKSDDLYAQELAKMRLGQMLCLGLNSPLSEANLQRGRELLVNARTQKRNKQAQDLASIFLSALNTINKKLAQGSERLYERFVQEPGTMLEARLLANYISLTKRSALFRYYRYEDREQAFAQLRGLTRERGPAIVHLLATMIMRSTVERMRSCGAGNDMVYGQWFLNCLRRDTLAQNQLPLVRLQALLHEVENLLVSGKTQQLRDFLRDINQNEPPYIIFKILMCCLDRYAQVDIHDHQLLAEILLNAQQVLNNVGLEETIFGRLNLSFALFDPRANNLIYNDHRQRAINELDAILLIDTSNELPEEQYNRCLKAIEIIRDRYPELIDVLHDGLTFDSAIMILRDYFQRQIA